jgi:hypothetical protein
MESNKQTEGRHSSSAKENQVGSDSAAMSDKLREALDACGKSFETICNKPQGHKGMCAWEIAALAAPTPAPAVGTCDLVSQPHQADHCGKAWRPICKCGHSFFNHASEHGTACLVGDCDCDAYRVLVAATPAPATPRKCDDHDSCICCYGADIKAHARMKPEEHCVFCQATPALATNGKEFSAEPDRGAGKEFRGEPDRGTEQVPISPLLIVDVRDLTQRERQFLRRFYDPAYKIPPSRWPFA